MPDRLVARLAAELDAVRPRHPRVAQARYRRDSLAHGPRRRLGGLATAAAVAALALATLASLATLATGSPNPRVWTGTVTAQLQRLQEPSPPAAAPQPTPPVVGAPEPQSTGTEPATSAPKPLQRPGPTDNARDGHGNRPETRPSPSPSGRDAHLPSTSDSSPPGR